MFAQWRNSVLIMETQQWPPQKFPNSRAFCLFNVINKFFSHCCHAGREKNCQNGDFAWEDIPLTSSEIFPPRWSEFYEFNYHRHDIPFSLKCLSWKWFIALWPAFVRVSSGERFLVYFRQPLCIARCALKNFPFSHESRASQGVEERRKTFFKLKKFLQVEILIVNENPLWLR